MLLHPHCRDTLQTPHFKQLKGARTHNGPRLFYPTGARCVTSCSNLTYFHNSLYQFCIWGLTCNAQLIVKAQNGHIITKASFTACKENPFPAVWYNPLKSMYSFMIQREAYCNPLYTWLPLMAGKESCSLELKCNVEHTNTVSTVALSLEHGYVVA